ncbi:uncharacterized protein [Littorina saxatilis]
MEQIELQRKKELLDLQRLEAITEKRVKAIKTYIRTKSGRLVERIIFLSEEDYEAFKEGKNIADILKKYLTSDEAAGLESWDKDEVVAIKTYVRTKSGRLVERLVYVSKDDYDAIKEGRVDANELLKKYVTGDESIEGWGEAKMKTIKTFVRTKSGRLIEKVIMISEEDYNRMIKEGMDPNDILKNYLSLGEGETIEGWQSGEPARAIKTLIRTKSGRLIEKTIYVSADDYDRMMQEGADPNAILNKYLHPDDQGQIESWDQAPQPGMKAIKTTIRTKSGRLIEKTIYITEEDYKKMMEEGGDPSAILNKYLKPEEQGSIEGWEQLPDPGMKTIKTLIRTKSGRLVERTLHITEEDYKKMMEAGGDPSAILNKYLKPDEQGTIESWEKVPEGKAMKVVKTKVRTKSGRIIEKTIMMTDEEYQKFLESGGDPEYLKKFMKLGEGETIEDWEKASTVYDDDDPEVQKAKVGARIVGKDGAVYEVVVDPITGKKYKKKVGQIGADGKFVASKGEKGKGKMKVRRDKDGNLVVTEETAAERARRKKGKRDADSDSDFSYRSVVSAGGTRRVRRRRKRADGTYSDSASYHSSEDEDGAARRRRRRRERAHGSDSDHSYFSVVSEGGTRHVRRKKRLADGTYGDSESYHSDDSNLEGGGLAKKKGKGKKQRGGPDSDHSYYSETSEGGTRRTMRKKRLRDKDGKVIGHGKAEQFDSSDDESHYTDVSDGKGGKLRVKKPKGGGKGGKGAKEKKWYDDVAQFSDATTDSDAVDLDAMTPEERERYLAERAVRRADREKKRREKYGEKYDEMAAAKHARKKDKKAEEAKVKAELEKKKKSGHEADDESDEDEIDPLTGRRKKKPGARGKGQKSSDGEFEYEYDDKGRVIKKKRIAGKGSGDSGSEYEYEYDEHGNVKSVKKVDKRRGSQDSDDGQYFEVDEKGQVRLKQGKKKIDLSKLTDEDLIRLGIDPSLSKQEIARLLKEKFGKDIEITDNKTKVGTKRLSEYGSSVDTDDLADDSDLDISTLKGTRRVNVLMKRGGQALADHMKRVIDQSGLHEPGQYAKDLDERGGDIDFLSHYRLVDTRKLETYARAFVVEDDDFDTVIGSGETRTALEGVPSTQHITSKQMEYVLKVLKIDDASQVTFRMFSVITAVSERVTQMDPLSKHLLEICNLLDIERKMDLYKSMFYCNVNSDRRDVNYIKADSLRIELIAGGLNWKQQQHIMERLKPNYFNEISFLDYICYIPLFLSMHDNIVDNPLDMSDSKYDSLMRKPSGHGRQRDMNPLGQPLSRASTHMVKHDAKELLEGKITLNDIRPQVKQELVLKFTKLPHLLQDRPPSKAESDISF